MPQAGKTSRGSGRRTTEVEKTMKTWHIAAWAKPHKIASLERKLASGKYTARDKFLYYCLVGTPEKGLLKLAEKMIPSAPQDITSGGKPLIVMLPARHAEKTDGEN